MPTTLRDLHDAYPGHSYTELTEAILQDPAIHSWLKQAIIDLQTKDPVDASKDALLLAELMTMRMNESLGLTRLAHAGVHPRSSPTATPTPRNDVSHK